LSILCLVVVGFMVVPEGTITRLAGFAQADTNGADPGDEAPQQQTGPGLEDRCTQLADEYGLTPREGEVLLLLAKGRNLSIVARDLYIAQSTARTHIEKVYRKLDVHKHQELIDLIEQPPHRTGQDGV
jgi:DNA-binding CsgD family transcriptional regulator